MISAISKRRSIRTYRDAAVPEEAIKQILQAGILAPSAKNRQPWNFIVVTNAAKEEMLSAMREGLRREETETGLLPHSKQHIKAAAYTVKIMEQAPVVIFIVNPLGQSLFEPLNPEERIYELCNMQSIGAAIENMALTAVEMGLGSLWIGDIFFAHQELTNWLHTTGELVAALAIGYADEQPAPRPRNSFEAVVEWRTQAK